MRNDTQAAEKEKGVSVGISPPGFGVPATNRRNSPLKTPTLRPQLARWLREPLLHFVALGSGLFVFWSAYGNRLTARPNRIDIPAGSIQRAIETFSMTHFRLPEIDELQDLVEDEIQKEVYYREGLALGLDRDDEIIRRRMQQKLQFLTQDIVAQTVPDDSELRRYMAEHLPKFAVEPNLAFSQIYLNLDRHKDLATDAAQLVVRLNAGDGRLDYSADSDPLPLPNDFEATPQSVVANSFGREFAQQLALQPIGRWVGPIRSGYGVHVVLLRQRLAVRVPQFAEVRDAVLREWQNARRNEHNLGIYRQLRAKYQVKVNMPPGQTGTKK